MPDNKSQAANSNGGAPAADVPLTEQAKQQAQQAVGTAKEQTQHAVDAAKQQAQQTVQQGQQLAGHLVDTAREHLKTQATTQKDRAATAITDVAQVLLQSSGSLRDQGHSHSGQYADQLAQRIAQVGDTIKQKDVEQFLADTETFARSQPALFIAATIAVGVVATRFLRSSGRPASA